MTTPDEQGEELAPSRFTWRHLDRDQARQQWEELVDWTTWIRERYELDVKIPPCWYRHGPVVEELSALMVAWTDAYYRGDEYRDALTAWHTQWFWPVIGRIRTISDFETCTHDRCTNAPRTPATLAGVEDFITGDVEGRAETSPVPAGRPPTGTVTGTGTVTDISAAQEVRTMTEADMDSALGAGLAEAVDPADPDSAATFDDIHWTYDARLGVWAAAV